MGLYCEDTTIDRTPAKCLAFLTVIQSFGLDSQRTTKPTAAIGRLLAITNAIQLMGQLLQGGPASNRT